MKIKIILNDREKKFFIDVKNFIKRNVKINISELRKEQIKALFPFLKSKVVEGFIPILPFQRENVEEVIKSEYRRIKRRYINPILWLYNNLKNFNMIKLIFKDKVNAFKI